MEFYVGMPVSVFVALVWVRYFDTLEPCPSCSRPSNLYLDKVWVSFFDFNMAYRNTEICYLLTAAHELDNAFLFGPLLVPRLQQVLSSPFSCETSIKSIVHHSRVVRSPLAPDCKHILTRFFRGQAVTAAPRFSKTIVRFVYPL